jgi:hypothetical protein
VSGDVPREQLLDPMDRMIGNAFEHVPQIAFRVQPVELGCAEQLRGTMKPLRFLVEGPDIPQ